MKRDESYFISAGEFSGDLLAADLVLAINEILPQLVPFGITGEATRKTGVEEIVSQSALSVMGVSEVAKKLGEIRVLESYVLQRVTERKPRFAVLVDFPGFHFRIAEQ